MNKVQIEVALGLHSEVAPGAMRFVVGEDFTSFGAEYTFNDLCAARAVLLDLADALTKKLNEITH